MMVQYFEIQTFNESVPYESVKETNFPSIHKYAKYYGICDSSQGGMRLLHEKNM